MASSPQQGGPTAKTVPNYIAHWVCKTARREQMIEWYQRAFDAEIVYIDKSIAFLTWDGESHRLALVKLPSFIKFLFPFSRLRRKLYGFDHIALAFGSLPGLLATYVRLRDRGIKPVWCINHGLTTSLYYEDPEGIRLEFQVDNFGTAAETKRYFSSEAFAKNPIGVNFDPEYLLKRLQSGVPERELMLQGAGTPPGQKQIANMKAINWRTL